MEHSGGKTVGDIVIAEVRNGFILRFKLRPAVSLVPAETVEVYTSLEGMLTKIDQLLSKDSDGE